jgi:ligand-binding sensor protein
MASDKQHKRRRTKAGTQRKRMPAPAELTRISGIQGIIDLFCQTTSLSAGIAGAVALQGPTHMRRFCNLVRSKPGGLIKCAACDMKLVKHVAATGQPTASKCHANLFEFAAPIILHENTIAVFFGGQIRPTKFGFADAKRINNLAKELEIPKDDLFSAYQEIPVVPNIGICTQLVKQTADIISEVTELALRQPNPEEVASELLANVSIVDWLRSTKEDTVLILGKDTPPESDILRNIQRIVNKHRYKSVLVKDYDDIDSMSIEQKVIAFAQASRFAILENSFPAGQIDECRLCAMNRVVTVMLRQKGKGSSFLVTDYRLDFPFMREFVYSPESTHTNLTKVLPRALEWAEATLRKRTRFYRKMYPWRLQNKGIGGDTKHVAEPDRGGNPTSG